MDVLLDRLRKGLFGLQEGVRLLFLRMEKVLRGLLVVCVQEIHCLVCGVGVLVLFEAVLRPEVVSFGFGLRPEPIARAP